MMSTQVAATKLSFPFSCSASLRQEKEYNQAGCIKVKALSVSDSQQTLLVVKQKHPDIIQVGRGPPAKEEVRICSEPEKLNADGEDLRPAAKRQLSSESAAKTFAVVKKSAVRNDDQDQPKLSTGLGLEVWPCMAQVAGKRRCRRDLFTDTEVFHKVDLHVLQAGAQVNKGWKCSLFTLGLVK